MLDWEGLGKKVAEGLDNYEYKNALDALSVYEARFSRNSLINFLKEALMINEIQPAKVHDSFCRLPFQKLVTTNFDYLLEKAYSKLNKFCEVHCNAEDLALDVAKTDIQLLKMHGDFRNLNRLVITENDYHSFDANNPALVAHITNLFTENTMLFIGYSRNDPDLNQIDGFVKTHLKQFKRQPYVLLINAKAPEIERFKFLGMNVINIPGSDYREALVQAFQELNGNFLPLPKTETTQPITANQEIIDQPPKSILPASLIDLHTKVTAEIEGILKNWPIAIEDFCRYLQLDKAVGCHGVARCLVDGPSTMDSIINLHNFLIAQQVRFKASISQWSECLNYAERLCGWLLLTSVNPVWWDQHENKISTGIANKLSFLEPDYIEVIISRASLQAAEYQLDAAGKAKPKSALLNYEEPVFDANDVAFDRQLLTPIYAAFRPGSKPTQMIEPLEVIVNNIIGFAGAQHRRQKKIIYYLVTENYLQHIEQRNWFKANKEALGRYIKFIFCDKTVQAGQTSAAIEDQNDLLNQVSDLLNWIDQERKHG